MDQKSWLWKKKSTEKTLAANKACNSSICNEEEETEEPLAERAQVHRDIRILNDKLSSALCECNSKDNNSEKQVKIAQEAVAGWEKSKAEVESLKELDKVLRQKAACEIRLCHSDAALKECMQQLRFVQEEQEKRVHGAVVKKSEEFEKTRIALDEKLAEASKKLAKLDAENAQLNKALSRKDKAIEKLSQYKAQAEADFNALMLRVESIEKENASLRYEVRVLEKELDIRSEEREFNLQTADVAQKQHQENVKKILKLESECQRLRLLVRKRLPGPASLTKMKNEVAMLGKDQVETRRRKSMDLLVDTPNKTINFLIDKLHAMEEENTSLKYVLDKKSNEHLSRTMYPRSASSGLSRGYGQVEESLKGQATYPFSLRETTLSDLGSDEKASSEFEHFKNEKQLGTPSHGYIGTPDMNIMDDFEEMEKLALVSDDFPGLFGPKATPSDSPKPGSAMVPVRIEVLLKILLEHSQELHRNPHQVLEDIKLALERNNTSYTAVFNNKGSTNHPDASGSPQVGFQTSINNKSLNLDAGNDNTISKIDQNVSTSIHKILELLEGINIKPEDSVVAESSRNKNLATPTGYIVQVLQWKTDQLSGVLQQFIQTCNDLQNGTANVGQFIRLVASSLDWVINHCFSLLEVPTIKDTIQSQSDWDESRSENEVDTGSAKQSEESSRQIEDMPYFPANGHNSSSHIKPNRKEEDKRLNAQPEDNESSITDLGGKVQPQHVKSEGSLDITKMETMTMKQSEGNTGDQIEKQKIVETYLEWREACQEISHLEKDLENNNNNNSIKRLEETSHDLKILLKSKTSKGVMDDDGNPREKQLRNEWEITAASEKLVECQQTILNLGKQLKALASPTNAALFDNVISGPAETVINSMSTSQKNVSRRLSLLDNMLAEDNNPTDASPTTKDDDDDIPNGDSTNAAIESWSKFTDPRDADRKEVASMAIVPRKRNGGTSLLKKLFWRQKKVNSKKTPLS